MSEPLSTQCSNTGHYTVPRWTCCACYAELGNIGKGEHTCSCGAVIHCGIDYVPSYVTTLYEAAPQAQGQQNEGAES